MNFFLVSSFITPPDVSGKGLKFYLWTFFFYFFFLFFHIAQPPRSGWQSNVFGRLGHR